MGTVLHASLGSACDVLLPFLGPEIIKRAASGVSGKKTIIYIGAEKADCSSTSEDYLYIA